jgi:hypothetical protein
MLWLTPIYLNMCENCKKLKYFLKTVTKIIKLKLYTYIGDAVADEADIVIS